MLRSFIEWDDWKRSCVGLVITTAWKKSQKLGYRKEEDTIVSKKDEDVKRNRWI